MHVDSMFVYSIQIMCDGQLEMCSFIFLQMQPDEVAWNKANLKTGEITHILEMHNSQP
jgi:hypothetical protein